MMIRLMIKKNVGREPDSLGPRLTVSHRPTGETLWSFFGLELGLLIFEIV